VTLSQFIPISPPTLFTGLLKSSVLPELVPTAGLDRQRTTVQLIAAVARHSPSQIAPFLDQIIPQILQAVDKDDDELREGSLQALEALVLRCPAETDPYLPTIVEAGSKYIKYDPVSRKTHLVYFLGFDVYVRTTLGTTMKTKKWQTQMAMVMRTKTWTSEFNC